MAEKKYIKGVGECLVLPTPFIEKAIEVIKKNMDDGDFYYKTKLKPFIEVLITREIIWKGNTQYCYITSKELKGLNKKFEEAQDKARMIF